MSPEDLHGFLAWLIWESSPQVRAIYQTLANFVKESIDLYCELLMQLLEIEPVITNAIGFQMPEGDDEEEDEEEIEDTQPLPIS